MLRYYTKDIFTITKYPQLEVLTVDLNSLLNDSLIVSFIKTQLPSLRRLKLINYTADLFGIEAETGYLDEIIEKIFEDFKTIEYVQMENFTIDNVNKNFYYDAEYIDNIVESDDDIISRLFEGYKKILIINELDELHPIKDNLYTINNSSHNISLRERDDIECVLAVHRKDMVQL